MKTVISIKTDKEVKENVQEIARRLGLSLSDVVNASLRNFIRTREVYFSDVPRMTPEFERLVGRVEKDIKEGKNLSKPLKSVKEVSSYLNSL